MGKAPKAAPWQKPEKTKSASPVESKIPQSQRFLRAYPEISDEQE